MLRAVGAEDNVLAVLIDPNSLYPEPLGEALQKIRTPAMPAKLVTALAAHRAWASALPNDSSSADDPKLALRYAILLKTLISYRDISTVPLLKSLLASTQNKITARVILSDLLALTDGSHRVQDPFVLAFGPVSRELMVDPWEYDRQSLREPALLLSVRTADDPTDQIRLLQAGLRDRSQHVQLAAAREAGSLGLTSLAPEVQKSFSKSDEKLRPYFCSALTALDTKCEGPKGLP
jgi:hypothetical protein